MRAVGIEEFGGREKLKFMERPVPEPGKGEILVAVKAAGVNPVDWKIREGMLEGRLPHEFPLILGWDAAGVVTGRGSASQRFAEGEEVYAYCRKPVIRDGAYAEYIALSEEHVARKPKAMSFEEATSVPLAALTAYQSLFGAAHLEKGETVLIHAAAGGVGGFGVQLAKDRGTRVLGTASARNHDYLKELGTDVAIDYTKTDFREAVRQECPDGVDVVFDCVGGEVTEQSVEILRRGGRLVSITNAKVVENLAGGGLAASYVFVEPSGEQLEELAEMIEAGKLRTHLSGTFPLEKAAEAHEQSESRHTRGKLVLTI